MESISGMENALVSQSTEVTGKSKIKLRVKQIIGPLDYQRVLLIVNEVIYTSR